jgi:hypothetical protein
VEKSRLHFDVIVNGARKHQEQFSAKKSLIKVFIAKATILQWNLCMSQGNDLLKYSWKEQNVDSLMIEFQSRRKVGYTLFRRNEA